MDVEPFLARIARVWQPHPGQREFLLSHAPTRVLACGRRWGKTDACAVQILHSLLRNHPPARCFLVAPTLEQARILIERVFELACRIRDEIGGLFEQVKYKATPFPRVAVGGSLAVARSGHRPRSLRGFEATDIVVDEAAFVADELVQDVLWPMMATTDGRMTLISTPNGRNSFWRMFQMGQEGGPRTWSRQSPTSENPLVRTSFLESQRELLSEDSFAVEYEAQFLDRQGAVFASACIERCLVPSFDAPPRGPFFAGIDFGRSADYTAVAVLCGTVDDARLVDLKTLKHPQWERQVDLIEGILSDYPGVQVVCDSTGGGSGPSQSLRDRLPRNRIECFDFTAKSKPNLIGHLRRIIERAALKMVPDPVLLRELDAYVEVPRANGSSYHAAHGHDDAVIALALAAWNLPKSHGPLAITL